MGLTQRAMGLTQRVMSLAQRVIGLLHLITNTAELWSRVQNLGGTASSRLIARIIEGCGTLPGSQNPKGTVF